jgi:phospholipase/carboxylesterase
VCNGRFLVICPQGAVETPIGPRSVGYGWFPFTLGDPPDLSAIQSATKQLRAFLDSCLAGYPIDPNKLVALGFSQGGVMAYSLALGEPERFTALVVMSSWLSRVLVDGLSVSAAGQRPATLIQHGSRDQLIDVDRARESVEILRSRRFPVTYREYDIGHEISPRSLTDLSNWLQEKVFSPIIVPE